MLHDVNYREHNQMKYTKWRERERINTQQFWWPKIIEMRIRWLCSKQDMYLMVRRCCCLFFGLLPPEIRNKVQTNPYGQGRWIYRHVWTYLCSAACQNNAHTKIGKKLVHHIPHSVMRWCQCHMHDYIQLWCVHNVTQGLFYVFLSNIWAILQRLPHIWS